MSRRHGTRWCVAFAVGVVLANPAAGEAQANQPATDLSGTWLIERTIEPPAGVVTLGRSAPTEAHVSLVQLGDSISGTYSSETAGEVEIAGTVENASFQLAYTNTRMRISGGGAPRDGVEVTLSGTIESADRLRGSYEMGGVRMGTFSARPAPER